MTYNCFTFGLTHLTIKNNILIFGNDVLKWLVLTHNNQLCLSLPSSLFNDNTFVLGDNFSLVSCFLHLGRVADRLCYDLSFLRGNMQTDFSQREIVSLYRIGQQTCLTLRGKSHPLNLFTIQMSLKR